MLHSTRDFEPCFVIKTLTCLSVVCSCSYFPTKGNRRMKAAAREIKFILRGIVNKRLRAREAGEAPSDDLLGILLESNLGQTKGNGMSTEELMEECKLFYFAGQETTTVLLVWTMVLLSQHQDWQARAREEVKQVFGDKEPDAEGLNQLKVVSKPNQKPSSDVSSFVALKLKI